MSTGQVGDGVIVHGFKANVGTVISNIDVKFEYACIQRQLSHPQAVSWSRLDSGTTILGRATPACQYGKQMNACLEI